MLARMRSINLVVIHCTGSPNGVFITAAQVDAWHRERGFKRDAAFAKEFRPQLPHIGYHRLILADGSPAFGRDLDEIGAHVQGHNANSVGVCMVGTMAFFLSQWEQLRETLGILALGLAQRRKIPIDPRNYPVPSPRAALQIYRELGVQVVGHRDLSPDLNHDGVIEPNEYIKLCPGFDVKTWLDHEMEPQVACVLDDHPAIAQANPVTRVMSSIRYGV